MHGRKLTLSQVFQSAHVTLQMTSHFSSTNHRGVLAVESGATVLFWSTLNKAPRTETTTNDDVTIQLRQQPSSDQQWRRKCKNVRQIYRSGCKCRVLGEGRGRRGVLVSLHPLLRVWTTSVQAWASCRRLLTWRHGRRCAFVQVVGELGRDVSVVTVLHVMWLVPTFLS